MQRPHTLEEAPPDAVMSDAPASQSLSPRDELFTRCMLLIVDKDFKISFANSAAKANLKAMRGDALESLRHSLKVSELVEAVHKVLADPHSTTAPHAHLTLRHRDGTALACTLEAVVDEQRVSGVAVFFTPRQATDAEAEKLYASVLDSLHQSVIAVDNDGRILYLNQTACMTLGLAARELRGMQVQTLVAPQESLPHTSTNTEAEREAAVAKTVMCGSEWAGSVNVRAKTGAHAARMRAAPLRSSQGAVVGSIRILEMEESADARPNKVRRFAHQCLSAVSYAIQRSRSNSPEGSATPSVSSSPTPNRQQYVAHSSQ